MSRSHASSLDADNAWGPPPAALAPPVPELSAADIAQKHALIQEILSRQDGLKALLKRLAEVQGEADKLKGDNATLQTYIDNLTRTNAVAAGANR